MTPQEMFDTALNGVLRQGGPSVDKKGNCLYRRANGRRCAAGWILPDEVVADYEGYSVDCIPLPEPFTSHRSLLLSIQSAHDVAATLYKDDELFQEQFQERFKDNMYRIAEQYGLEFKQ